MADQLYTNEILLRLASALDGFTQATTTATGLGIPMTANVPFFRMGEPVRIPVSPTSGGTRFPSDGTTVPIPPNVTSFMVTNNNPFAVRLKGTRAGQDFQPVTATTGWLYMPGAVYIFTTVNPAYLAAMSVDGPMAASDPTQKAGTGFIELQYGTGV